MQETDFLRKKIEELLRKLRAKSGLSQSEVAERIGLPKKSGHSYVSRLESGKAKNLPLLRILSYLRVCGASWVEFFKELDRMDFKLRHEQMIEQLSRPPEKKKIERDAMRYEIGVEFPSKEKEEIDFERLKKIIKEKVVRLVNKEDTLTSVLSHRGRGGSEAVMTAYQKFASEHFDFLAALNKPGMKMVIEKYQRAGLARHLLFKIAKISYSVIGAEIKRIEAKKPLPTKKQEKMTIGFTKYRIRIEKLEAEAHKLLCELGVPTPWFASYKAFTRQCYRTLKKYFGKNQELLNKTLAENIVCWKKEGLKEDVLLKLKDKIISVFRTMRLRGEI